MKPHGQDEVTSFRPVTNGEENTHRGELAEGCLITSDVILQFGNPFGWRLTTTKYKHSEIMRIVLLDNSPPHPKEINPKLKNVTVFYFPPNTTSKLQPMDQGMIKNFKVHYRKRILRKLITTLENNQSVPNINLRESISEFSKAWKCDVTDRTIHNSFAKAGFFVCSESSENTEDEDDIPTEEMKNMDTAKGKTRNY
ncbi:tigger transposable element-derived protein 4 [Nephila pilipes]|uniref:Tigger transposable element-derived protein 4 n=1 Tax=Nephila pilipes TaxID=299642 RepID=A0A8X6QQR8_NEPPI|nr:tigger transposable element-derived protein 4 [Nephila pilipes]